MRHFFYCDTTGWIGSVGLLVLRLVMGTAFILHGWSKFHHPLGWTGWMGPDATVPAIFQALATISEFGGGLALVGGLLTRLGSLGIISVMVVALATFHIPKGDMFVGPPTKSFELPAVYLACAILFLLLGSGRFSLDALLFYRPAKPEA